MPVESVVGEAGVHALDGETRRVLLRRGPQSGNVSVWQNAVGILQNRGRRADDVYACCQDPRRRSSSALPMRLSPMAQ
jgi:hypothetical protein